MAQHGEQKLSEHNQTLARRLNFRGIAFTLIHTFQGQDQITEFLEHLSEKYNQWVHMPQAQALALPTLDLPDSTGAGNQASRRRRFQRTWKIQLPSAAMARAITTRLPDFQQSALVLQCDALPYYYVHVLYLVAQTQELVFPQSPGPTRL